MLVVRGGGGVKGIGGGRGCVGVGEGGGRSRSVLGRVISDMSVLEILWGREAVSSSSSVGGGVVRDSGLGTSRSRAKRRGEALRAFCAASGVR